MIISNPINKFNIVQESINKPFFSTSLGVANLDCDKISFSAKTSFQNKTADEFLNCGYSKRAAQVLSGCSNETQLKRALDLIEKGVDPYSVSISYDLDEKSYQKLSELVNRYDVSYAVDFAEYDDDKYNRVVELAQTDSDESTVSKLAKLDDVSYQKAKQVIDLGIPSIYSLEFTSFDEVQTKNVEKLLKQNVPPFYIHDIAVLDEQKFKRAEKLLEKDISLYKLPKYADYTSKLDFDTALNLSLHFSPSLVDEFVQNNTYDEMLNSSYFERNKDILLEINNSSQPVDELTQNLISKSLLNVEVNYSDYSFEEKNNLINNLNFFMNENKSLSESQKSRINIPEIITNIKQSMKYYINSYSVDKDSVKLFSQKFMSNKPVVENIIKNADFKKFKKEGLPLKYPRDSFLSDLNSIIKEVSDDRQKKIFNKLHIVPNYKDSQISGFDGILNFDGLNREDNIEKAIYDISNKFINENEVKTGDKTLDESLNALIRGIPEFINIIGKKPQKPHHQYSIDIHSLIVLQESMKNNKYDLLSDFDKTCLKFAVLFHDMAKKERTLDKQHPKKSALYVNDIMKRFPYSIDTKDRIFELVRNHHWMENYNKQEMTDKEIAARLRHPKDFDIQQIISEADLKGISPYIYDCFKDCLLEKNTKNISDSIEKMQETGQIIFADRIVNPKLIPEIEYKGNKYKVINFNEISNSENLGKYGFVNGIKKNDLRFLIHSCRDLNSMINSKMLTNIQNKGFLSASYISLDKKKTFDNLEFGLGLNVENVNIANAYNKNQGSQFKKTFSDFLSIISGQNYKYQFRKFLPNQIKDSLNISDEDYVELYKQISNTKYRTQINDNYVYKLNNKNVNGVDLRNAIQNANDTLLAVTHNELTVFNPKINSFIAKVDDIEDIPISYLKFIKENNLPIFILGKD